MPKKRTKFVPLGRVMGAAAYAEQPEAEMPESHPPAVERARSSRANQASKQICHTDLEGHVKLWNADRGFGFIEPDDDLEDVFVHVSGLSTCEALSEDDVVKFDLVRNEERGGLQAVNVRPTGYRAVHPRHTGIVVFWKEGQFGFIEQSSNPYGDNLFAHSSDVLETGYLEADDEVTFEIRRVGGRARAFNVRTTGRKFQSQQGIQKDIEKGHNCARCRQPVYDCPCRDCSCAGCARRDWDDALGPNVGMSGDPGAARRRWLRQLDGDFIPPF